MGTRHMIQVVRKGRVKVAQYGQFDGYLSGHGQDVVDFLDKVVRKPELLDEFQKNVGRCRWVTEEEVKAKYAELGIGSKDGWMTLEEGRKLSAAKPEWTGETGAGILQLILDEPRTLSNGRGFAADSLFCEWAYVVDLDKMVLEVYRGFQAQPHKGGRFWNLKTKDRPSGNKYYPVRLIGTLKIQKGIRRQFSNLARRFNKANDLYDSADQTRHHAALDAMYREAAVAV